MFMPMSIPPLILPQPDGRRVILFVARGLDSVGTGRQIELAAEAFLATGWTVHLAVTTAGGSVAARLARVGVAVHQLGTRPVIDAATAARLGQLARGLKLGRSDAVLAWGRSQARLAAAVRLLIPTCRLVCHLAMQPSGAFTGLAVRQADQVIASSPAIAAACERLGVAATKIVTISPAADAAAPTGISRADLAARLGLDSDKLWTLCVAPLVAEARLERLLWAVEQLGAVHQRLEHVLVGAGPLRNRILRRARVQELTERLHLFPQLDCLPDLLREARLVWQSGNVACGGAILDGMAAGIPAVAVTSDAVQQLIVDGETGRIVLPEPESELPRRAFGIIEDDLLTAQYAAAAKIRAAQTFPADQLMAAIVDAVGRVD